MMRKSVITRLVARALFGAAITATSTVAAAADIFLQLQGIPGESTDKVFKGQIELLSYSQSFRSSAAGSSGGGDAGGRPICGDIIVTKAIDASSARLIANLLQGTVTDGAINFREGAGGGGGRSGQYYNVRLIGVSVMAIEQTDRPDPARIVENVLLRAAEFDVTYSSGGQGGTFGWNCTLGIPRR